MSLYTPKKMLSVDDAAPKESPKDYAIPKEPLKELLNNQTKYCSKPKPEEKKPFRIQWGTSLYTESSLGHQSRNKYLHQSIYLHQWYTYT